MKQFTLPDPGEGLVEAEIVTWKVKPGDTVKVNDIVVEVETAKSLVELPIPWAGTVSELLVAEGATVDVGAPIILIDTGEGEAQGSDGAGGAQGSAAPAAAEPAADESADAGDMAVPGETAGTSAEGAGSGERVANLVGYGPSDAGTRRRARRSAPPTAADTQKAAPPAAAAGPVAGSGSAPPAAAPTPASAPAAPAPPVAAPSLAPDAPAPAAGPGATPAAPPRTGPVLAKPPVRKFAKDRGVDLALVSPSRADGVVSRADVEAFLAGGPAEPSTPAAAPVPAAGGGVGAMAGERGETREPVKGVRKMTAQAMVSSAFTAPHVTEFVTVDATATIELVERLRADREFRDLKVSPLLVLAKAMTIAVRRNPGMNAAWDEAAQEIVHRHYVNLGIAAATPRGLIVPVIQDADRMDLRALAAALGELIDTARAGRTQPAQMSGGTITVTNVGVFGIDTGTPIINPGESAIVCFGAIRRQPWVVTAPDGSETIEPRWVTQLSVSFDHRLIDGELGSRFLADLGALVADPSRALVWG